MFNDYIENDDYLKDRRGDYAEQNRARTPFTNMVDLKLAQDINIKLGKKTCSFQVTYDVFNLTNLLNDDWGKQYFKKDRIHRRSFLVSCYIVQREWDGKDSA